MNEPEEATTLHLSLKQNFKVVSSHQLLSFSFSQDSDLPMLLIFPAVGEYRRRAICTRFGRYLQSTKLSWIINAKQILLSTPHGGFSGTMFKRNS